MRIIKTSVIVLLMHLCVNVNLSSADFLCKSTISYTWKRAGAENSATTEWKILEARGTEQGTVSEGLEKKILIEKREAMEGCRQIHESLGSCVTNKFGANLSTISQADFLVRRSIVDGINKECDQLVGVCLEAEGSKIECKEVQVAAAPEGGAAAEGAAGDAKKGDKKEEKKK